MNGILCINKPKEFTSFDVVKKLRGITKVKKIGHAGTLDPMATGVLPLFLGVATKACDILPNQNKRYTASFKFGETTDTQDVWGKTTATFDKKVTLKEIIDVLDNFRGEILQTPPMYSAVQIDGKRLYDLARKGIEVERAARKIHIFTLELLEFDEKKQSGILDIACSKGTYIRTLINDIGESLNAGAIMTSLNRTEASGFKLAECLSIDEVENAVKNNTLQVLPIEKAFIDYPEITLSEIQTRMFSNGVKLDINRVKHSENSEIYRIYDNNKLFLGLGKCNFETMELKVEKFFIERK